MIFLLFTLWFHPVFAEEQAAAPAVPAQAAAPVPASTPASIATPDSSVADDGEYEIDYEEEPDEETPPPVVTPKAKAKAKKTKGAGGPSVQGSIAKDRFVPILKSETKSIYKKNGKALDVDSD